jgi:hypothetical protein
MLSHRIERGLGRESPPAEARLLSDRLLNTDGVTMRYPPHNYEERNDHEDNQRNYPFHFVLQNELWIRKLKVEVTNRL